jgi:hypothetical protein
VLSAAELRPVLHFPLVSRLFPLVFRICLSHLPFTYNLAPLTSHLSLPQIALASIAADGLNGRLEISEPYCFRTVAADARAGSREGPQPLKVNAQ